MAKHTSRSTDPPTKDGVDAIPTSTGRWESNKRERPDFEAFFHAEYERLVRSLRLLLRSHQDAEDVAQESFVRVLERWDRVAFMESRDGYLYRVSLNLARRKKRSSARELKLGMSRLLPSRDPADLPATRDVRQALESLPGRLREVLVLAEWIEMTTDEISRALGVKPSTVRVRLHRARKAFRDHWGNEP